jgi:RNA polymerase sigma-70 factor (ECF subfamily)
MEARARLEIPPLALDDEDLLRIAELSAAGEEALRLLDQLPPAQRDAVRAHVLDERGYQEMALELGHSEQLIRQQVSRGLRRLRTLMEGQR